MTLQDVFAKIECAVACLESGAADVAKEVLDSVDSWSAWARDQLGKVAACPPDECAKFAALSARLDACKPKMAAAVPVAGVFDGSKLLALLQLILSFFGK